MGHSRREEEGSVGHHRPRRGPDRAGHAFARPVPQNGRPLLHHQGKGQTWKSRQKKDMRRSSSLQYPPWMRLLATLALKEKRFFLKKVKDGVCRQSSAYTYGRTRALLARSSRRQRTTLTIALMRSVVTGEAASTVANLWLRLLSLKKPRPRSWPRRSVKKFKLRPNRRRLMLCSTWTDALVGRGRSIISLPIKIMI